MLWPAFTYKGTVYDLAHLHPKPVVYVRSAEGDQPERQYKVDITYSLHCFSHKIKTGECPEPGLLCSDHVETRVFDFDRWKLSFRLPEIIEALMQQKCFHTGHNNFFTIELLAGKSIVKYEIFFTVSKSSIKGRLNLFVQTAFVRTAPPPPTQRRNPPIKFNFILYNTLNNRPIKLPK